MTIELQTLLQQLGIKGVVNRQGIRKMTPKRSGQGFRVFQITLLYQLLIPLHIRNLETLLQLPAVEATAKEILKIIEIKDKMITGNKGEWSEIYVLLKI